MSTDTTTPKTRTITLTDRPPVKIREDEWPVIASAKDFDGQIESQANRSASIRVREHLDGRRIVYGASKSNWQNESGHAAGHIIAAPHDPRPYPDPSDGVRGDDPATIRAIHAVAEAIGYSDLAEYCIADLPAEEL